jgi:hypothetical protein
MKIIFRLTILFAALFFAVGGFFAWQGVFDSKAYIIITGIVGSLASIISLVTLANSRLTTGDVRSVEAELFQTLADQVKSAKEYDEKIAANREELTRLEHERVEIELLVRQASLKIFMEERLRHIALDVSERIKSDKILINLIKDYHDAEARVRLIDGEIERSPEADRIKEILEQLKIESTLSANRQLTGKRPIYIQFMGNKVNIRPFLGMTQELIEALALKIRS